jgi:hypothetical protein
LGNRLARGGTLSVLVGGGDHACERGN